jgi:hypothetical protein
MPDAASSRTDAGRAAGRFRQRRADAPHARRAAAHRSLLAPVARAARLVHRPGRAGERIGFSPYGLDPRPARAVTRTRAPQLRIGYIGTLMVSKGPDVLLDAFRELSPGAATVELFGAPADYHGETGYARRLEPLLSTPGVTVSGPRPHAQIPGALASMDVMVAPSIWPENSPFVIQEALLSGIPVIGSRIGGIPELIEDGRSGLLFEPGNVDGLHRALERLLDEPGLLDTLTAGARATSFRTLDDDVHAANALYEQLVSTAPRPHPSPRRGGGLPLSSSTTGLRLTRTSRCDRCSRRAGRCKRSSWSTMMGPTSCAPPRATWGPAVAYLHTGANLGFAGGINAGVRRALDAGRRRGAAREQRRRGGAELPHASRAGARHEH